MHQSILRLPPLVTINQMPSGQIRFHYSADSVGPLQAALIQFANQLLETAIYAVQAKRDAEVQRQQMPASRIETIDAELAALQARRAEVLATMSALPPVPAAPPTTVEEAMAQALAHAATIPLPPPTDPLAHPGLSQVPPPLATPPDGVPTYYVIPPAAPSQVPAPAPIVTVQALPVIVPTPVQLVPLGP